MSATLPERLEATDLVVVEAEGRIPFRLRIGVTGHRDLDNREDVAALVQACLITIRERFPVTPTTPVVFEVLSSLAEGADRLVVQAASSVLGNGNGIDLHVVLPFAPAEYTQDFTSRESIDEFDQLLARSALETSMPPAANREDAYERAGRYVVDHSDVVIAVWDGREAGGRAGTADIVKYARRRGVPVTVIPAERASGTDRAKVDRVASATTKLPSASEAYRRTVELNARPRNDAALRRRIEREQNQLSQPLRTVAARHRFEQVTAWALRSFVRADTLAVRYQSWHFGLSDALYLIAALAVTTVAAQSQAGWASIVALVEVGLMLLLLAVYAFVRGFHVHERWLGYRSLAEALRSAVFIASTGAVDRSGVVTPETPGARNEPWYQRAFSEAWRERPAIVVDQSAAAELRDFLLEGWVEPQIRYHRNAVDRLGRRRRRITRAVLTLFGLTVVIGLLHAFEIGGESSSSSKIFIFLAVSLPAFGAALTGIRDQRQYRVHEQRSRRTAARLEELGAQLARETELGSIQRLAAQVQTAIEADKLDWWGVIEFQNVEILI